MALGRIWLLDAGGTALLAFGITGVAQSQIPMSPAPTSADPIFTNLRANVTVEDILSQALSQVRRLDQGKDGLDAEDIARAERVAMVRNRGTILGQVLSRDLNGDLEVTSQELDETSESPGRRHPELQRLDRDGDGTISLREIVEVADSQPHPSHLATASALLSLDPNGDGKLTPMEAKSLIEARFAQYDADGDGTISQQEFAPHAERLEQARLRMEAKKCALPPVPKNAKLVVYSGYESDAISSAWVGGSDQVTHVLDMVIEEGAEPLYIVASSYESMIWQISGAKKRVANFVVAGHHRDSSENLASGVTGLPRERVHFVDHGCIGYFTGEDGRERAQALATIEASTGRKIDSATGAYSIRAVHLPSGKVVSSRKQPGPANALTIVVGNQEAATLTPQPDGTIDVQYGPPADEVPPPMPEGFDGAMWRQAARYWPGGLVKVDPKTVISNAKVGTYEVLPSQMGLSQLLGSGAITRNGPGFTIVKPIAHMPPGMSGAHSTTLTLGEGVPLPPGVHSCVRDSDGTALANERLCRDR